MEEHNMPRPGMDNSGDLGGGDQVQPHLPAGQFPQPG